MPRVLVLSATTGYQLRSFAEAAERLGVELAYATDRCHALDDPWQDAAIPVRFHQEADSVARIVAASGDGRFDGIVVVGDRPMVLAALAAEALGLRGNPPAAARASSSKLLARRAFAAAGLYAPWFETVAADADARDVAGRYGDRLPAVVKPLGLSGSRGVIRVDSTSELEAAFRRVQALLARPDVRALRSGLEHDILIEGYQPGREYALEGVLTDGKLQTFAIFDKPDPLDGPFFEETIYVTPPALSPVAAQTIVDHVARGAAALGLREGPIHAECRMGSYGVFLLEIAARPIGGLCSNVLRFSDGSTLEEVLLRHALGEDVASRRRETSASAVMMIPIPKRGLIKRVDGEALARGVSGIDDVRITAKPDQLLEPLPEAGSYLGFVFAHADTAAKAEAAVRSAHQRLTFVIETPIDVTTRAGQRS